MGGEKKIVTPRSVETPQSNEIQVNYITVMVY